jgi:hypothetical protein
MKYTTSPELRPPPHIYGDRWERSSSPWHKSGFPGDLQHAAPDQSKSPKGGWSAVDNYGNEFGFVVDGTDVEATAQQIQEMKPDLRDALMQTKNAASNEDGVYDEIAEGRVTRDRAMFHLKCLATDCGWRADEVQAYIESVEAELQSRSETIRKLTEIVTAAEAAREGKENT